MVAVGSTVPQEDAFGSAMIKQYHPSIAKALLLVCTVFLCGCATYPLSTSDPLFLERHGDMDYCELNAQRQQSRADCGAAALATVLAYWDAPVTADRILRETPPGDLRGYSLGELHVLPLNMVAAGM